MPHILAIDTATDACSVAIQTPSGVYQTLSASPRKHTQCLLPAVKSLLAEHQLCLAQLDAIAFTVGPGSFTGLRIGISVAQGLAYGADLPLIPVSTLQTMAQTAVRLEIASPSQQIVPIIDARMNEVYWSAYAYKGDQKNVQSITEEWIDHPEKAIDPSIVTAEIVGIGSGWAYTSLQHRFPDAAITVDFYPQAYDVAILAEQKYQQQQTLSPLEAKPTYIRDETSWKKRQRIRQSFV
ncbi:tRNA (adenosine(37)-N6)-threonylcarbamoyltransferase complex dimerization subunit type 1 TsaB [Candidatus Endobugula sertula]|uniref:tRNA threonylcarbamoyladenosine biosynthesis protein TsaB n=1 Tax=Candidatus Endobugula sertula TaxID=62101 RepID=A0A1D2QQ57_9GAMM|nr:tRNA (adenosine(37)-N6)-threonylcarbamoyltransferase complex dimerization subunit type 1 TsaB [Candidatus Endobugula sertula]